MDVESVRNYCLSLPLVTEDCAFGDDHLLFRVSGKIFACVGLDSPCRMALKCDADYALELRDRYSAIEPAFHWNKKYWNQLSLPDSLGEAFVRSLIRRSYAEVVKKLPKSFRNAHPEVVAVVPE